MSIMAVIALLCCLGVSESSKVSTALFTTHMILITILIICAFIYGCKDGFETFHSNLQEPLPDIYISSGTIKNSYTAAIYFSYCSALLGKLLWLLLCIYDNSYLYSTHLYRHHWV